VSDCTRCRNTQVLFFFTELLWDHKFFLNVTGCQKTQASDCNKFHCINPYLLILISKATPVSACIGRCSNRITVSKIITDSWEGASSNFCFTSVLSRVKVALNDTVIRLEHLPMQAETGVALEIRIKRLYLLK
jgi:hypothetical protein